MQSAVVRNVADAKELHKTREGKHITLGGFLDGQGLDAITIKIGPLGIKFDKDKDNEVSR